MTLQDQFITAAIVVPVVALIGALFVSQWKTRINLLRTLYSDKRFEEITRSGQEVDIESYKEHATNLMFMAWIAAAILLSYYTVNPHVGVLLWGVSALLGGFGAFAGLYTTKPEDLKWDAKARKGLSIAKYTVRIVPIIVLIASIILPRSEGFLDEYVILNLFGLAALLISVAGLPIAIGKVWVRYFEKR